MSNPTPSSSKVWSYSNFDKAKVAFMEGLTGPPCVDLVIHSGIGPRKEKITLLDNACGGGVLTAMVYEALGKEEASKIDIVCGDFSDSMVACVDARIKEEGWNAVAKEVDAQAISFSDAHFDFVLTNFGVQLIPDTTKAFQETYRVLKPNGIIGFTNWTSIGWLSLVPNFPMKEPPLTDPVALEATLREIGFVDVKVVPKLYEARYSESKTTIGFMKGMLSGGMSKEMEEGMVKKFDETFGEGEVFWTSGAMVITARKP